MAERWRCPNCQRVLERTDNVKAGKHHSVPNWAEVTRPDDERTALREGSYRGRPR